MNILSVMSRWSTTHFTVSLHGRILGRASILWRNELATSFHVSLLLGGESSAVAAYFMIILGFSSSNSSYIASEEEEPASGVHVVSVNNGDLSDTSSRGKAGSFCITDFLLTLINLDMFSNCSLLEFTCKEPNQDKKKSFERWKGSYRFNASFMENPYTLTQIYYKSSKNLKIRTTQSGHSIFKHLFT